MTIGQRVAQAIRERTNRKVKPELVRMDVCLCNFYDWEKGKTNPSAYVLQQMALSGYDIYWILTGERKKYEI